ncbi:hypothetical protein BDV59DRAFT_172981 [Aspergillus ambiguus]|uniref:uncharacterized protein n=1 Tax=Aspergillus ambiguus TaxID=176160 RepID=UPI003CCE3D72
MKFSYVQIFAKKDGILYSGKYTDRFHLSVTLGKLQNVERIRTEDRAPEPKVAWSAVYVKTPSLLAYLDGDLEKRISHEIETCEILRKDPHPNIATYYGYQETNGRVAGLCFQRYTTTLLEAVNPLRLSKGLFLSSGHELVTENIKSNLKEIPAAIKHLHSLRLVHNDVNPANIMSTKMVYLFSLVSIAVGILESHCAIPKRKEYIISITLLWIFRLRRMTLTLLEISNYG